MNYFQIINFRNNTSMGGSKMQKNRRSIRWSYLFCAMFALLLLVTYESVIKAEVLNEEFPSKTYRSIVEVEDWGPVVTKLIVNLGDEVLEDEISPNTFNVYVERRDTREAVTLIGDAEGYRTVVDAYISDEDGNPVTQKSNFIVLEMEYGPTTSLSSPMNYSLSHFPNDWIKMDYIISQKEDVSNISGSVIKQSAGETRILVDEFMTGKYTYENITLTYADYAPTEDNKNNPLIVWLHGMGEGGTDPIITVAGNKVVNFITEDIQDYFGGAYVLSPQTPTYWMDGYESFGDGTSIYQDALMNLIEDYVATNPGIDPNRIYIGGASNGGYMTMLMVRDYPEYFAAAFPICEGLHDELISEQDIVNIAKTPLWFVHAKNDFVLDPEEYTIPTYHRLVDAGATVYLTLLDDVSDTSGRFFEEDGSPYQYDGHMSWIYVFNNEVTKKINQQQISLLEWLSLQELNIKEEADPISSTMYLVGTLILIVGVSFFLIKKRRFTQN